jgi:predicted branched-subunit amino acid permease
MTPAACLDAELPAASAEPSPATRRERLAGATAMLPITVGYLPFALLIGVAVGRSADPLAGWAASPLIYGGSAQLTVLEMTASGAGLAAAVSAALLINLRLIVYSAALAPLWATAPRTARLLAAATVIDPTWMIAERRAAEPGSLAERRAHYAGAAVVLTVGWCIAVAVGAILGATTDLTGLLAIATPLCLVAIVAPHMRRCGGGAGVSGAAAITWLARDLPPGTGLLLAMATAAALGHVTRRWRTR